MHMDHGLVGGQLSCKRETSWTVAVMASMPPCCCHSSRCVKFPTIHHPYHMYHSSKPSLRGGAW